MAKDTEREKNEAVIKNLAFELSAFQSETSYVTSRVTHISHNCHLRLVTYIQQ